MQLWSLCARRCLRVSREGQREGSTPPYTRQLPVCKEVEGGCDGFGSSLTLGVPGDLLRPHHQMSAKRSRACMAFASGLAPTRAPVLLFLWRITNADDSCSPLWVFLVACFVLTTKRAPSEALQWWPSHHDSWKDNLWSSFSVDDDLLRPVLLFVWQLHHCNRLPKCCEELYEDEKCSLVSAIFSLCLPCRNVKKQCNRNILSPWNQCAITLFILRSVCWRSVSLFRTKSAMFSVGWREGCDVTRVGILQVKCYRFVCVLLHSLHVHAWEPFMSPLCYSLSPPWCD